MPGKTCKHWRWKANGWLTGVRAVLSPNHGERPAGTAISLIVLHNISLPPGEFGGDWVEDFFVNRLSPDAHPYFATIANLKVSAHFYIRRGGRITQFVSADRRAWHAGQSRWQGRENCNDYALGIELEGSDHTPYSAEQYESLFALIESLRARYPIEAIAGHCHVAPERKSDPGPAFDWTQLRQRFPNLHYPDTEEKSPA